MKSVLLWLLAINREIFHQHYNMVSLWGKMYLFYCFLYLYTYSKYTFSHLIHNLAYYNVYCRVYVSSFPLFVFYQYTSHTLYFHYTVLTFIFPATI